MRWVPEGRGIFGELDSGRKTCNSALFRDAPAAAKAGYWRASTRCFRASPNAAAEIARTMSGGEQQMVAIGRGADVPAGHLSMLDEPSLGLSPVLTKELFRSKSDRRDRRRHSAGRAECAASLKIADRGYLIEVGCITGEGTAQSLMSDPAVVKALISVAVARGRLRQSIRLPAPFVLPGDLAAMGPLDPHVLRSRAGAIQSTFVAASSRQRRKTVPSAFTGRVMIQSAPILGMNWPHPLIIPYIPLARPLPAAPPPTRHHHGPMNEGSPATHARAISATLLARVCSNRWFRPPLCPLTQSASSASAVQSVCPRGRPALG